MRWFGAKTISPREAVQQDILIKLNQEKLPGCYYHRSNPNDVARVEQFTFICTPTKDEAGPTNNWARRTRCTRKLTACCEGSMKGRTMYVVPYLMGPPGSPLSKVGVEITDSIYVVLNMRIMTRMGAGRARSARRSANDFNRGLHSHARCESRSAASSATSRRTTRSSRSAPATAATCCSGKKCLALRIGSYLGRNEGWMAEHMLILGVESPEGEKTYVAAAFPSACGKTNFAMLIPPKHFEGWKITTIGDDIAWMQPGADGRLYAINPEAGYFGVAPGTNYKSNPNAMKTIARDTIYTNVALTPDGDVWWEGKDGAPPDACDRLEGQPVDARPRRRRPRTRTAASPRRCANNPSLAPEVGRPAGRADQRDHLRRPPRDTMPLIFQAFNWIHGVYLGATHGLGDDRRRHRRGRPGAPRPDGDAALLRLQHGRLLPATGCDMRQALNESAARSST